MRRPVLDPLQAAAAAAAPWIAAGVVAVCLAVWPPIARGQEPTYQVIRNAEESYSVWRAGENIPEGWRPDGFRGTLAECLEHIDSMDHGVDLFDADGNPVEIERDGPEGYPLLYLNEEQEIVFLGASTRLPITVGQFPAIEPGSAGGLFVAVDVVHREGLTQYRRRDDGDAGAAAGAAVSSEMAGREAPPERYANLDLDLYQAAIALMGSDFDVSSSVTCDDPFRSTLLTGDMKHMLDLAVQPEWAVEAAVNRLQAAIVLYVECTRWRVAR